jgi:hypothetical protein
MEGTLKYTYRYARQLKLAQHHLSSKRAPNAVADSNSGWFTFMPG